MHPRILDRRKAIALASLKPLTEEEWDAGASEYVSRQEKYLPRPENYRKKPVARLRNTLRNIDKELKIVSKPGWGDLGVRLSAMLRKHRQFAIKELSRRLIAKGA